MKNLFKINKGTYSLLFMILVTYFFVGCTEEEVDNAFSRIKYNLELNTSAEEIVLNEATPDEVALTLDWTPAVDYGSDFIISYVYEIDLVGSSLDATIKEYEDEGNFSRSYTHKELQDMLVNNWGQLTSTNGYLQFTVTASFDGPRVVIPEVSVVKVKVKTYGPIQFLADRMFMSGTAVGENDVEISTSASNSNLFVYTGDLSAGTLNFPINYGEDEKVNTICPTTDQQDITSQSMDAQVLAHESAGDWIISEAGKYRITINMSAETVTIIPFEDVIDVDKIYVSGTCVDGQIEVTQTLENENCYAFRGELQAGSLYLPILFENEEAYSIVPSANGISDIDDGNLVSFSQIETQTAASSNYWNITTAGLYRIVVNIDTKTITIYSPATDLQSKEVSWNNTVDGINPYIAPVETLWMYGGFNSWASDGNGYTGYDDQYKLVQSLANPNIFVYKGDNLPRETITDSYDGLSYTGAVKFTVSNIHNNVYAYGSSADAKRNSYNGYLLVDSNAEQTLVEGQSDNRYAYFLMPENTNFVMVDIENLTVVFDSK